MTITFDNLPKEIMEQAIEVLKAANPTMKLSRADWFECVKLSYDIKTKETDSHTHIFLEPKEF